MYKHLLLIFALIASFTTTAHVSVSDERRLQITEQVIAELGYLDAIEVEKRARLEALDLPMPLVTGNIIEQGSCLSFPCPIPSAYADMEGDLANVPDIIGIKGIKDAKGNNYRKFSAKLSSVDYINSGATDDLKGYQMYMTWRAGTTTNLKGRYVVVDIEPEFFQDDQPPKLQFVHINVNETSPYKINVRALYDGVNPVAKSAGSANNKSSNNYYSYWSYASDVNVEADSATVVNLAPGPLKNCILVNGYPDQTLLMDIEQLDCANGNLDDNDRTTIQNNMGGLRKLNLSNNPSITTFGGMGQLSFLSWFEISGNNTANLNSFDQYGQIDSFVYTDSGLTVMPHVPRNSTYIDLSGNNITSSIGLLIETGNPFEDRNRDQNIQALDLSRDPALTQPSNFETDLLNTLSGYHVKALDLSGHQLNNMNAYGAVNGLRYLTLNDTDFSGAPSREIEVSGFKGLCALTANNANINGIKSVTSGMPTGWPLDRTPIQYLSLQNNPTMNRVIPLSTSHFKPHWLDMSGSEAVKCHLYYPNVATMSDPSVPHLTDMAAVLDPFLAEQDQLSSCLVPTSQPQVTMPDGCKMSKPDVLTLYDDTASGNRFATWEVTSDAVAEAYNVWGVNRHDFYAYDTNGEIYRTDPLAMDAPIQAVGGLPINRNIGVAACKDSECGYIRENFTIKQGLTEPAVASQQWLDEYQVVFNFTYPQSVFDDADGKGRPDYLQIVPDYQQPAGTPEIPIIEVSGHQSSWSSVTIYYPDYFGHYFLVKACSYDLGCTKGNWFELDLPNDPIPAVQSFNVAEDLPSNTRMLAWSVDANALPEFPGVSTVKILMYDQNMNVIDQLITEFDINQNHLLINDSIPTMYGISLCDVNTCGPEVTDSVFEPGLAKVTDVDSTWNISTPGQFEVTISFAYPQAAFNSTYGKPDHFSIKPLFETEADEIIVPAGNTFRTTWNSAPINENDFIGEDFSISACSVALGCGAPYYMVLKTPLESADLPVPEIVFNGSNNITNVSGSEFSLAWTYPAGWTQQDIEEVVDYIEITESQPYGGHSSFFAVGFQPIGYLNNKTIKFYSDDVTGPLDLKRMTRGEYGFTIRACSRDRINGDVCSAASNSGDLEWHVRRSDVSSGLLNRITNQGWYQRADGTFGVRWNFPANSVKTDRFILETDSGASPTYCINYTNPQKTTWEYSASISIDYAKVDGGVFDSAAHCDDIKMNATTNNVSNLQDPNTHGGQMALYPCTNGNGCGGKQYTGSFTFNKMYVVDFSTPPMSEPSPPPAFTETIIGGPGDMKPGAWWNPDQSGTGWHFYWASELRYPAVHENYGKTYDLLGYWMAYKQTPEGVWTPTWFYSLMKQTSLGNQQYFQGELLYVTANGSAIDQTSVGRLQVHFDNGDNQHVQLKFDVDYENNVFSRPQSSGADSITYIADEVNINIESFDQLIVDPSLTYDNNADHYSGAWAMQNQDGSVNPRISWLTWIDHYVEVSTILTYDEAGDPIWLQAETCSRNPELDPDCDHSNYPVAGYFDNYVSPDDSNYTIKTVKNGFNPLGATPSGDGEEDEFILADQLVHLGTGGRQFAGNGVESHIQGQFWLHVTNDVVEGNVVRDLNIIEGSQFNMTPMSKQASFHDIRFFINEQNEWEHTCDPNNSLFNGCQIRFTWFTDDYFESIEPYYSQKQANGSWSAKQPLNDLCPGVPMGQFVTTNFVCDSITEAGEYRFYLHKDNYIPGQPTVEIAMSEILTIEACLPGNGCDGTTQPLAAAEPPGPENHMELIAPDPLNDLVGVTAGAFDVDESGSANYSLPIFAPKGRGGLAPQLALSYNSNAGNGIAGQGWNISGTSSITRCLKSKEHDPGIALADLGPITMTWDDAFCLDGMRLHKVSETATEVEYRTELANFSKIIAQKHVDYPNGPRKFTVYTKSGETWGYGSPGGAFKAGMIFPVETSTGAQILANDGETVHTWLLAQIAETKTDTTHLNRIKFSYDTQDGESYLSLVRWSNFDAGEVPHYEVHFQYDQDNVRADAMHHYGINTEYKSLLNLDYVSTYIREANSTAAALQEVRRLQLTYEEPHTANNPTGAKRLISARQCLNAGTCLQPVEFTWDDGNTATGISTASADIFAGDEIHALQEMGYGSYKPIDINGDGIMEMMFIRGYDRGNWLEQNLDARYWIAAKKDTIALQGIGDDNWPWGGNGCVDLNDGNQHFDVVCNTGIQPFHADEYHDYNAEMWFIYDFNADGNQDMLSTRRDGDGFENYQIFLSNGQTICQSATQSGCSGMAPINTGIPFNFTLSGSAFLDFTGDGLPDLMTFDEISDSVYQYKIFPSTVISGSHVVPSTVGSYAVDLDSDLLAPRDMVCENVPIPPEQGGGVFARNLCVDIYAFNDYGTKTYIDKVELSPTDLNGDGVNDLMLTYTYEYLRGGFDDTDTCELPAFQRGQDAKKTEYPDYQARPVAGSELEPLLGIGNLSEPCAQQFKAFLVAETDTNGQVKFNYAGRAGILKSNLIYVTECEAGVGTSSCLPNMASKHDSSRVQDVNGDGLGDLLYLDRNGNYRYQLNLGYTETYTYDSGISPGYSFEKLQFSPAADINQDGIPSGQLKTCDVRDRDNDDTNACARNFLTQFIDYDLDGDLDVLMPKLVAEGIPTTSYYQLHRYGLQDNGEFGYSAPINTTLQAYYTSSNRQPQDFNNAIWDVNGDSHYDYFSLLRRQDNDGDWDTKQVVKLGSNSWQTRNKITQIENQLGAQNLESKITIDYVAATEPGSAVYTRNHGSLVNLTNHGEGSPVFDVFAPMYLVSQVGKTAPTTANPNGLAQVTYAYEGFKMQGGGRGALGFAAIMTYDPYHDVLTTTQYRQDFPFIGMPQLTQVDHDGHILSYSHLDYLAHSFPLADGKQTVFPYLKRSYEKSQLLNVTGDRDLANSAGYSVNGAVDHKVVISDFTYDISDIVHGNLSESDVRTCVASVAQPTLVTSLDAVCGQPGQKMIERKFTENTYADNASAWFLGRLASSKTTSQRLLSSGGYGTSIREAAFAYDPVSGQLTKEEILGNALQYLKTFYTYDEYGQSIGKYQCSQGVSDAICPTIPQGIKSRPADNTYIHRFSETVYDNEWNQYVALSKVPHAYFEPFDHFSDTNAVENSTDFVLDPGQVINASTMRVNPDFNQPGAPLRNIYGSPYLVSNINGIETRTVYGAFGDAHASASVTGGSSSTTKRWCSAANINTYQCPATASTVLIKQASGAPTSRNFYDTMGREVRSQVRNFIGEWQTTDTQYDVMGRTVRQSDPYTMTGSGQITSGGSPIWTVTKFDPLDRVVFIQNPSQCVENFVASVGAQAPENPSCVNTDIITTTTYNGLMVATTNAVNQTTSQMFDLTGKVMSSQDALGGVVNYGYDAQGNLTETTSYLNGNPITITMQYDHLGRKVSMNDPDKGFWQYIHNAAGEVIEQKSANSGNNWSVRNWYDIQGRMVYRVDADGSRSIWEYDIYNKYGLLVGEHVRGQYQTQGIAQSKRMDFDQYIRPSEIITTVYDEQDPLTPAVVTYVAKTTYDQYSRVFQQFDSLDDSFDELPNGLQYFYNNYGYQHLTRDAENGLNGQEYYRLLAVDQRGQVVHERKHGNFETWTGYDPQTGLLKFSETRDQFNEVVQSMSYAFDPIGNLTRRTDSVIELGFVQHRVNEYFQYDGMNRLKDVYWDANDVGNLGTYNQTLQRRGRHTYDATGNLLYNSGANRGLGLTMEYNHPAKPHAVTRTHGGSVDKTYHYDNNGNVTQIIGNSLNNQNTGMTTIDYSSFDKATRMEANGWISDIRYAAGRGRFLRKDRRDDGSDARVTHYLGTVEYIYESGTTRIKRHLGDIVIELQDHSVLRNQWQFSHLLKDHLGSTHTVVNKQGQQIERFNFSAWGERRRPPLTGNEPHVFWPYWYGYDSIGMADAIDNTTNRGFTGHEHFDQVGIIHMNGRIYDPSMGRFLQADPIIQDPYNTQSLNRYSYVMNNPLSYTDPSGYSRLRKGWWRMPVAIAVSIYTAGAASSLMSLVGTANTATIGLFGSTMATITSANAVSAALITSIVGGAISGAVASGNLKGAVKGGVMAALTFGIGHGGGGGRALFGKTGTTMAHSIVSGISAEVDGGKFGHGFASAILSMGADELGLAHIDRAATRIVANAVVAGTISELTGGKFSNGALNAAFRVAFNHILMVGDKPLGKYAKPGRFVCQSNCSWKTEDAAHLAAAEAYVALSIKEEKEYGWNVYQHADGSFTYTFAHVGTKTAVYPGKRYSDTDTYKFMSSGHTHVDGNLEFSPQDVDYVTHHTTDTSKHRPLYLFAQNQQYYYLNSETALNYSGPRPGSRITSKVYTTLTAGQNVPMSAVIHKGSY
ncbi:RHS repeat-associated core domain-containing protein [Marinicella meishanensis]|uniref:RHS repeat-associated core domain-containing protein n=1 Tax=Marinicella meishanensis TaxID=2873263 RepID=UPI001CC14E76|nr:RHS repeat-associated core domain-containing protein [Marinicella sp. NBU2979]